MPKKIKTITEAVPALLTWMVAEITLEKFGMEVKPDVVNHLVAKANYHFNTNDAFKKCIMCSRNRGRDYLYAFMEHWVKAKEWELHGLLPKEYEPYQESL